MEVRRWLDPCGPGSVSFGLVNIPVRLFPAIREHDVHFHQLAPDGSRIRYKRVSEKTGREVEYQNIRKGYSPSRGKDVVFEQDELKEFQPRSTKTVDIEDFVALEDIDPLYFERTYHLVSNGDAAAKAYALLTAVMEDRQRVGVGKVVIRDKQYLCAIRPYGKGLALSTMLFADEVVPQSDIEGLPARTPRVDAREKKLAAQIVDSLERDWDASLDRRKVRGSSKRTTKQRTSRSTSKRTSPKRSARATKRTRARRSA